MSDIKNLFFIDRFPFNKDFFNRFEFLELETKGYHVKYIDISSLLKRQEIETIFSNDIADYRLSFVNKNDFRDFIKEHKDDSVILTTVPFVASACWMYLTLFKNKMPYILLNFMSFPTFKRKTDFLKNKNQKINRFFRRLNTKRIIKKPLELMEYRKAKRTIYPAKMLIISTNPIKKNNTLINEKTLLKYSFSLDYKEYKKIKDSPSLIEGEYAVFVDQYFCHHPDFKTHAVVHSFTAEDYYPRLNKFLLDFSKKSGLKIIIASHPRRNKKQENDFNPKFEIYYNETAKLIKHSNLVLMHFSTAISFAVIMRKPFMLLNSKKFEGSVNFKTHFFAHYFNKDEFSIDHPYKHSKHVFDVNEDIYREYEKSYIIHPKAMHETFSEKVTNFLDNYKNQHHPL